MMIIYDLLAFVSSSLHFVYFFQVFLFSGLSLRLLCLGLGLGVAGSASPRLASLPAFTA